MSRKLKFTLYAGFGVLCLFAGLLLTFPYEALGRRLEFQVAQAIPGATLVIKEFGPALPFGLKLADITFTPPVKEGQTPTPFQISKVRVTPAWLKLLTLKPGVAFTVDLLGGQISGQAVLGKESRFLDLRIEKSKRLQLDDGSQLEKLSGLQLQGGVYGTASLVADAKTGAITSGAIDAQVDSAKLIGGKVMGMPAPATDLGSPEVSVVIEKGEGKFGKVGLKSGDLDVSVTGGVTFRADVCMSPIHGAAKVKLTEDWMARNPLIKSLLGPRPPTDFPINGTLCRPVNMGGGLVNGMRF
jgi:type II secretion system protein N